MNSDKKVYCAFDTDLDFTNGVAFQTVTDDKDIGTAVFSLLPSLKYVLTSSVIRQQFGFQMSLAFNKNTVTAEKRLLL